MNKLLFLNIKIILSGIILILFIHCEKRFILNEELNDCDSIGNYYEDGNHYISRELVNEDGSLNYKKYMEKSELKNSKCNPVKNRAMKVQ